MSSVQPAVSPGHSSRAGADVVLTSWLRVLGLGAVGFALSGLLSGVLGLGRDAVVLGYTMLGGVILIAFFRLVITPVPETLQRHWRWGLMSGVALGALLTLAVVSQPPSGVPSGWHLAGALVWLGIVYGLFDGLLLTVAPVLALSGGETPELSSRQGAWRRGVLGLVASTLVTAAYHLGYAEFRGPKVVQPLVGNAVLTAGYLMTGSIATPLIGHVIMHGAAVLHGMETTAQLPPHYPRGSER